MSHVPATVQVVQFRRRAGVPALLLALVLVIAACGGADDVGAGDATEDTAAEEPLVTDTEGATATESDDGSDDPTETADSGDQEWPVDGSDAEIGFVIHVQIPFTAQIVDGAEVAAEESGAQLNVAGPTAFDPPQQVQIVEEVILAGAQAVATVPFPEETWTGPISDIDVPVLSFNVAAPSISEIPVYVGEDSLEMGSQLAELLAETLGAEATGDVVLGNCGPGFLPLELRAQGVTETLAELAPGLEVLGPFETSSEPAANFSAWESLSLANPDAVAFVGICAQDLPNLAQLKSSNAGDYEILGVDLEPESLTAVADGVALGTIGQSPYLQGYVPVRILVEHLVTGSPIPEGWISVPLELVTDENVAEVTERENSPEMTREYYQQLIQDIFSGLGDLPPISDVQG